MSSSSFVSTMRRSLSRSENSACSGGPLTREMRPARRTATALPTTIIGSVSVSARSISFQKNTATGWRPIWARR